MMFTALFLSRSIEFLQSHSITRLLRGRSSCALLAGAFSPILALLLLNYVHTSDLGYLSSFLAKILIFSALHTDVAELLNELLGSHFPCIDALRNVICKLVNLVSYIYDCSALFTKISTHGRLGHPKLGGSILLSEFVVFNQFFGDDCSYGR